MSKLQLRGSVPYKRKKSEIFSGIFALNFCEVRHFFSCQKLAFLFPAENRRQLQFVTPRPYLLHETSRILGYLRISQTDDFFFFLENNIKRENKMPLPAQRPFVWRKPKFEQNIVATDREHLKSSRIFTLSSEHSHHFQHYPVGEKLEGTLLRESFHMC